MSKYFKVKIIKASKLTCENEKVDVWYSDKIGDTILVKRTPHDIGFYEAKNGSSVIKADVIPITEIPSEMIRAKIRKGREVASRVFYSMKDAKEWYQQYTQIGYTVSITEARRIKF